MSDDCNDDIANDKLVNPVEQCEYSAPPKILSHNHALQKSDTYSTTTTSDKSSPTQTSTEVLCLEADVFREVVSKSIAISPRSSRRDSTQPNAIQTVPQPSEQKLVSVSKSIAFQPIKVAVAELKRTPIQKTTIVPQTAPKSNDAVIMAIVNDQTITANAIASSHQSKTPIPLTKTFEPPAILKPKIVPPKVATSPPKIITVPGKSIVEVQIDTVKLHERATNLRGVYAKHIAAKNALDHDAYRSPQHFRTIKKPTTDSERVDLERMLEIQKEADQFAISISENTTAKAQNKPETVKIVGLKSGSSKKRKTKTKNSSRKSSSSKRKSLKNSKRKKNEQKSTSKKKSKKPPSKNYKT